ncbi:MAG: glycogen synthase [Synergistaceae bacterium]|jgi:starch synthase|nr:glycogen synthase [Synergistaceae bacterium]
MKVLFASSEARPFFSSGDLGEMAGGLSEALNMRGDDVRVIMPLYGDIDSEWKRRFEYVANFTVPVSWRSQYCGLFKAEVRGVLFYFLDNEYYFKRDGVYGFYDDGERFAFFSRAVLEMLSHSDFAPDVIHCNDWQTGLAPVYLNLYYRHLDKFSRIKTVFTIHDLQYQGQYGPEALEGTVGIGRENFHTIEFDGIVNYTKGAIEMADLVNTVSPTYAKEIMTPWYGHGLYEFLRLREGKLRGILNGVDTHKYDPSNDPDIAAVYDSSDFEGGKAECKKNLRDMLGLSKSDEPIIGMVTPFETQKGLDLMRYMADEILGGGLQIVITGNGEAHYRRFFDELAARHSGQFAVRPGKPPGLARQIYAGSDMFLMPSKSEPCGIAHLSAMRYGSAPIVRETGGLKDTVSDAASGGNGFTFAAYSADEMRDACFRARDMYRDREAWHKLVKRCMERDSGWSVPANEYSAMYEETMGLW